VHRLTGATVSRVRIVPHTHAADWAEFTAQLPEDGCRYAVLSFSVMTKTGVIDPHKLVFFSWCAENASVRAKMMHAASKAALRQGLSGVSSNEIHAGSDASLEFAQVYAQVGGRPEDATRMLGGRNILSSIAGN